MKNNKPTQVGGEHYAGMAIGPAYYAMANGLGYCEANVVKYVSRWRNKGGIDDLRKAAEYIEMLIDFENSAEK